MKRFALLLCFPISVMAAPYEAPSLARSLDKVIATRFKPDQPGVAALVSKNGKPILRKAYGMANLELGVRLHPGHVFRIGSTTKLFTAAAIMMLVEDGSLALDAPVTRYLPDAPRHWDKVTIEHLLTHTSGIPNLSMDSGYWRTTAPLHHTLEELVAPARDRPLEFTPGSKFVYSNTGYHVLGMVIGKVSGKDYFTFLDARILKPLALKHTREGTDTEMIPGLVTGYRRGPAPAWLLSNSNFHAGGGLVSTVDDLAAFMIALQAGKIVPPARVRQMNTSYMLPNGEPTGYGLGTWLRKVNGKQLVGHGGYILNFYSQLEMDIDSGIVAVTLHNGDRFGGDNEELSKQLISAVQQSSSVD